jgi:hypothetical protein
LIGETSVCDDYDALKFIMYNYPDETIQCLCCKFGNDDDHSIACNIQAIWDIEDRKEHYEEQCKEGGIITI